MPQGSILWPLLFLMYIKIQKPVLYHPMPGCMQIIHALRRKLWSASGSILGPLLFLMYIYLKACSLSSYARMYTDDTYLTPCAIDPEMLQFELNHYLEIVHS